MTIGRILPPTSIYIRRESGVFRAILSPDIVLSVISLQALNSCRENSVAVTLCDAVSKVTLVFEIEKRVTRTQVLVELCDRRLFLYEAS